MSHNQRTIVLAHEAIEAAAVDLVEMARREALKSLGDRAALSWIEVQYATPDGIRVIGLEPVLESVRRYVELVRLGVVDMPYTYALNWSVRD